MTHHPETYPPARCHVAEDVPLIWRQVVEASEAFGRRREWRAVMLFDEDAFLLRHCLWRAGASTERSMHPRQAVNLLRPTPGTSLIAVEYRPNGKLRFDSAAGKAARDIKAACRAKAVHFVDYVLLGRTRLNSVEVRFLSKRRMEDASMLKRSRKKAVKSLPPTSRLRGVGEWRLRQTKRLLLDAVDAAGEIGISAGALRAFIGKHPREIDEWLKLLEIQGLVKTKPSLLHHGAARYVRTDRLYAVKGTRKSAGKGVI